jgi:hypothetical protein
MRPSEEDGVTPLVTRIAMSLCFLLLRLYVLLDATVDSASLPLDLCFNFDLWQGYAFDAIRQV